jgi:hypothetical protein
VYGVVVDVNVVVVVDFDGDGDGDGSRFILVVQLSPELEASQRSQRGSPQYPSSKL